MEQFRATLSSVAQLLGEGLLTAAEAAEMKAAAMQDFNMSRCGLDDVCDPACHRSLFWGE